MKSTNHLKKTTTEAILYALICLSMGGSGVFAQVSTPQSTQPAPGTHHGVEGGWQSDQFGNQLSQTFDNFAFAKPQTITGFQWQGVLSRYEGTGLDIPTRTVPCRVVVTNPSEVSVTADAGRPMDFYGPRASGTGI